MIGGACTAITVDRIMTLVNVPFLHVHDTSKYYHLLVKTCENVVVEFKCGHQ